MDVDKCNEMQPAGLERRWEIIWRYAFLRGAQQLAKMRHYLWWGEMKDHDWSIVRLHAGNAVWRLQQKLDANGIYNHADFLAALMLD